MQTDKSIVEGNKITKMEKSKTPAKGTYVSRSVYQKKCEENKRLVGDIYILTMPDFEGELKHAKGEAWRNKFKKDSEFNEILKEIAKEYFRQNPEKDLSKI